MGNESESGSDQAAEMVEGRNIGFSCGSCPAPRVLVAVLTYSQNENCA
jgi:hypothetical protein